MLQDIVDVGAHGGNDVDTRQVASSLHEATFNCVAINDQNLAAPAVLAERCSESLGLGILQLKAVDDHETVLCLGGKRHLEAERANLLVERLLKLALAGTVSLTTADEHWSAAIAVTSRAAAL